MTIFVQDVSSGTPPGVAGVYDYPSLSAAVQAWFARPGDPSISGYIDYFIQVAEAKIYRDIFAMNKGSGVQPIETVISTTINANSVVPLPTGYLGLKYMLCTVDSCVFQLERRNAEFIYTQFPFRGASGSPQYVARDAQNFVFGPSPDSEYTITGVYWQRFPQLTAVNSVTWMVQVIPTIILAACCMAVARFLKDEESMQLWSSQYMDEMTDFLLADRAEEQSGSAFAMVSA
jgi:hypothetical protein